MLNVENQARTGIPDKFKEHPMDKLRPDFMHHVVSPLAHTAVVRTVDIFRERFLADLQTGTGEEVRRLAGPAQSHLHGDTIYRPDQHANLALIFLNQQLTFMRGKIAGHPVWRVLTFPQKQAASRFTSLAIGNMPDENIFFASGTISDTITTIHNRHPELGLDDTTNMAAFLRDPMTPGILRGFAIGGNAFPDSLRNRNDHPVGKPWRDDPTKAVLDTSGEHPRTSRDVRDAAYAHRRLNQTMAQPKLRQGGIFNVAMRYSSGCPVRHLQFRIDEKSLLNNNLSLTANQVALLMPGPNPVVEPIKDDSGGYHIARDATATMAFLFADALEIIAK